MDQLIPSLAILVETFRSAFARPESFNTFRQLLAAWIIAPSPRTISELWQATGRAATHHWDAAYSFFASAQWEWDDIAKILLLALVARFTPIGRIVVIVDDTLCHKRGAKVAFGGFYLDAVTSTQKHKNFRFGVNLVVIALSVHLPWRPDRPFALPVIWRVYRKKGTAGHRTRTVMAAEMMTLLASWLPARKILLIGDNAYLNSTVLANRPSNLQVLGPLRSNAALYLRPALRKPGTRGRPPVKGERLPKLKAIMDDTVTYPAETLDLTFGEQTKTLRVQVLRDILWPTGAGRESVTVVLIRDPAGQWRDEVLLATGPALTAAEMIALYCRRWSVEVLFRESKQLLGLHDPQVRTEKSVERAHSFSWLVYSLTILWYREHGEPCPKVQRSRPWYRSEPCVTFSSILGTLRLQQWDMHISEELAQGQSPRKILDRLKHWLAAVR